MIIEVVVIIYYCYYYMLLTLGTRITREEADAMMEEYDIDKSGSIDFNELMMLMFKVKHGMPFCHYRNPVINVVIIIIIRYY